MRVSDKIFSIFKRDISLFLLNLATGIFVARVLGPKVFGIWVILALFTSYAEVLFRLKADIAAVYYIGQKKFKREDILSSLNLIALVSSIVVAAIIFIFESSIYDWLFSSSNDDYRSFFWVISIQIPLQFFNLNYSYYHIAQENYRCYIRMTVINSLTYSFLVVALLWFYEAGIWGVIIATLVGIFLSLLYGAFEAYKQKFSAGVMSKKICFELIKYGMNFYGSGLLGMLQQSGVNLIAVAYLPTSQMAFLSQGQGVSRLINKIIDPINTAMFPIISRSTDGIDDVTCRAFRVGLILILSAGLFFGFTAEIFIVSLYGDAYKSSVEITRYLLPGIVISGASSILLNYFNGTGRAKIIFLAQILPTIFQLCISWVALIYWGLTGASIAISFGLSIYGIYTMLLFLRSSNCKIMQLIPNSGDIRCIFSLIGLNALFNKN